jgi:hypothetical protein
MGGGLLGQALELAIPESDQQPLAQMRVCVPCGRSKPRMLMPE